MWSGTPVWDLCDVGYHCGKGMHELFRWSQGIRYILICWQLSNVHHFSLRKCEIISARGQKEKTELHLIVQGQNKNDQSLNLWCFALANVCTHPHRTIVIHNILLQNNLLAEVKTHEILRSMQAIAEPYFKTVIHK